MPIAMIRVRITHFSQGAEKLKSVTALCTYTPHDGIAVLDDFLLDIVQIIEPAQFKTYFNLWNQSSSPVTTVDVVTPISGRSRNFAQPSVTQPQYTPLSLDIAALVTERNRYTTDRTFDLQQIYIAGLDD